MSPNRSLIAPTANPLLERSLLEKLRRRNETGGSLGELEPLAVRLGLMQNTLKPRFQEPQLVFFASDHGLVVDGIEPDVKVTTQQQIDRLLRGQLPATVFARVQEVNALVVDCGVADALPSHDNLLQRKIAHGSRNARVSAAMTIEQAHAGIRAGMEIGDKLRGNVVMCAGLGVGAHMSAALVLSRLTECPVRDLLMSSPTMDADHLTHLLTVARGALTRHRDIAEPVDVLAALGSFDIAVMVGVMLAAAAKRHLIMTDGMTACAALMVAQRIAPPVTDYTLFCRSHLHHGLDHAMHLFRATAILELGLDSADGTGAVLAWPLVRSAAALLTEVAEGEEPGPTRPAELNEEPAPTPAAAG